MKGQCYELIAARMRENGKTCSTTQVQTKIKNLRKNLSHELGILKRHKDHTSTFPFLKDLEFLFPFTRNSDSFNQVSNFNPFFYIVFRQKTVYFVYFFFRQEIRLYNRISET
ncbi:MAG: hypothetical protein DI617_09700 [Streptococcus pyogenes]|nr:MAG: hypothetical protein DI617_09700 [Streptococcus pyogenes]